MTGQSSNKLTTVLFHSLFWLLYITSEYLADFPHLQGAEHWVMIRSVLIALPLIMVPTYFVVLFLIPKVLKQDRWFIFIISLILLAVVVYYGRIKWLDLVSYFEHGHTMGQMPASKVLKNVIRDYSVIALAVSIYIISDWRKKERENIRLIREKAKTDLALLKQQLHPHFLFNTLNNIYSLALAKSDKTIDSILKLSKLLEYLVYQSGEDEIPLIQELDLARNYIDLEKLRYGKELQVELEVSEVREEIKTAPLILLPFLENCFKHGGKDSEGIFWIKIRIRQFENILLIHISNSKGAEPTNKRSSGVGLRNIKERLATIYPNHELKIEDNADFYSVDLKLNKIR